MAERKARTPGSNAKDLALIEHIRNGDDESWDLLISKYFYLCETVAQKYFLKGGDNADLVQAATLGLIKSIRDFDETKGVPFSGFAGFCIQREVITALKQDSRQKHSPLNQGLSLDAPMPTFTQTQDALPLGELLLASELSDPLTLVIGKEEFEALISMLRSMLSTMEKRVFTLYLDGHSYETISGMTGISEKSVDNALQRIKRKTDLHLAARTSLSA